MKHFRVVSDLSLPQINFIINSELKKHYRRNYLSANTLFYKSIRDWLIGNQNHAIREKLDRSRIERILTTPQDQENEIKLQLLKRFEFERNFPKFSGLNRKLEDFLVSQFDQLTIYETQDNDTHWASLMLYQNDGSIFYLNTKFEVADFEIALEILLRFSENRTVVIECTDNLVTFTNTFLSEFLNLARTKLVLVCEKKSYGLFEGLNLKKITESELTCEKIDDNSLKSYLDTIVNFQGVQVELNNLIDPNQLKKMPLNDLDLNRWCELGESLVKPLIYTNRKLQRKENSGNNLNSSGQKIIGENMFNSNSDNLLIVEGIAGMGKTEFAKNLCFDSKQNLKGHWVQYINLNQYSKELNDLKKNGNTSDEEIQKYFVKNFMKTDNELKLQIANDLLHKGRAMFFFDGYDEVCGTYELTVPNLISALLTLSEHNKFYISTRPEWSQTLEEKFSVPPYLFQPFSDEDQIQYLMQFWAKDYAWYDFIKKVLTDINESISDKGKTFVGVPLTTKLIGEYFKDEVEDCDLINNQEKQRKLLNENLTLFGLLNHFKDKTIEEYCNNKVNIEKCSQGHRTTTTALHRKYEEFAYKIIFCKTDESVILQKDEDLVKCGLVNGQYIFQHLTIAENFVTHYFIHNSNETQIIELLFNKILLEKSYQTIRSFINCCIDEILTPANREKVRNLLKIEIAALNKAAEESNMETFNALFDVLTETRSEHLVDEEIQKLLLDEAKDKNFFYNYFTKYEIDKKFLDKLNERFGPKFVKKMLKFDVGYKGMKIMSGAARHGKNYAVIMKWVSRKFVGDSAFMRELMAIEDDEKNNILHHASENIDINDSFISFLSTAKIIIMENLSDTKSDENLDDMKCDENFEIFKKILLWINTNDEKFLKNFVSRKCRHNNNFFEAFDYFFKEKNPDLRNLIYNELSSLKDYEKYLKKV